MSLLYPITFALEERHVLVGLLDNTGSGLLEEGHAAEGAAYGAAFQELWDHTSHPTIDLPSGTIVTVSLTADHWALLAGSLDVDAFQFARRHPEESALELRLRDRIIETLGDAMPALALPTAPKRDDVRVPVGEVGWYRLDSALDAAEEVLILGEGTDYDAWINQGNGLMVGYCVVTGTRDGSIDVTAELLDGAPPLETGSWDDIAEGSLSLRTVAIPGPPPEANMLVAAVPGRNAVALFELDPVWPSTCMFRVRVSVRNRDAGTGEHHLIQMWRAPSAPEKLIKGTDLTGRRRRLAP
ncbi:hypothetical protein GCM10022254_16270 [Actinomadura meridiana]|uniref:Uncharacterized protein n=2 Tax=Actinomadura meridiana TaxID=559626 RepID=A0ABP8BVN0_9ACTN